MKRTRCKICGLTRQQDVQTAVNAGVDAIGLVFYPPSPRAVTVAQAKILLQDLPPYVQSVGLFVNATFQDITTILSAVPLDILQFHGDESPAFCQSTAHQLQRRWYKALQVHDDIDLFAQIHQYRAAGASAILLDAWHPTLKGGTGLAFDWTKFPHLDIPLILAGGLTPDNIQQAIATTRPYAVDVSGGVESAKGIKDPQRIERFMQGVHLESRA